MRHRAALQNTNVASVPGRPTRNPRVGRVEARDARGLELAPGQAAQEGT